MTPFFCPLSVAVFVSLHKEPRCPTDNATDIVQKYLMNRGTSLKTANKERLSYTKGPTPKRQVSQDCAE